MGRLKIDTNKAIKYLVHGEFCTKIAHWKHQKQPLKGIRLKCFSQKSANPWKEPMEESVF